MLLDPISLVRRPAYRLRRADACSMAGSCVRCCFVGLTLTGVGVAGGCTDAEEAERVEIPLVVDSSGLGAVTNDLGYVVVIEDLSVAIKDVQFTVAGEAHSASMLRRLKSALVAEAVAHPGHYQGGEVTGELPGAFIIELPADDGRVLGQAVLLEGEYTAANFTFDLQPGLDGSADTAIHTALLHGSATRDGETVRFVIALDSPEGRVLVGAPFEARVSAESLGPIRFRVELLDPNENDTLFDGLDFSALDDDRDGRVVIAADAPTAADAYQTVRRSFQTHDHYRFSIVN